MRLRNIRHRPSMPRRPLAFARVRAVAGAPPSRHRGRHLLRHSRFARGQQAAGAHEGRRNARPDVRHGQELLMEAAAAFIIRPTIIRAGRQC